MVRENVVIFETLFFISMKVDICQTKITVFIPINFSTISIAVSLLKNMHVGLLFIERLFKLCIKNLSFFKSDFSLNSINLLNSLGPVLIFWSLLRRVRSRRCSALSYITSKSAAWRNDVDNTFWRAALVLWGFPTISFVNSRSHLDLTF